MSDLMADLRAAVEMREASKAFVRTYGGPKYDDDPAYEAGTRWASVCANDAHFMAHHGPKLLALLEAGRACRDDMHCESDLVPKSQRNFIPLSLWCQCDGCKAARQYDEAAK